MILLGQEHRAVVEEVRIRVVSVDQENFGNVSASRTAFDMYHHVQGVGDVGLNRAVRQFEPALQDAAREPREALLNSWQWWVALLGLLVMLAIVGAVVIKVLFVLFPRR